MMTLPKNLLPEKGVLLLSQGLPNFAEAVSAEEIAEAWSLDSAFADASAWREVSPGVLLHETEHFPARVFIVGVCTSAFEVAYALIKLGKLRPLDSVLALQQTAGRGQLRRPWASPKGNMYGVVSMPPLSREWLDLSSMIVGRAVLQVVHGLGADAKMKWPNDVLIQGKKAAGVLIEERREALLAGVGMNLRQTPTGVDRDEDAPEITSLKEAGISANSFGVWRELVVSLRLWYQYELSQRHPAEFVKELEAHLAWMGATVHAQDARGDFEATLLGLLPDGGLRLDRQGSILEVHSGTIRPVREGGPPRA